MMRCRVGLEPAEPAPPDREGPVPDPCEMTRGGGVGQSAVSGKWDVICWRRGLRCSPKQQFEFLPGGTFTHRGTKKSPETLSLSWFSASDDREI